MQLRGAWDWNNPWLLCKQPSERDLGRCRLLPLCDATEQIDQSLICLKSLRSKPRRGAVAVVSVKGRVSVDPAGEESLAQRAVGDKADSEFLEGRDHFLLRSP